MKNKINNETLKTVGIIMLIVLMLVFFKKFMLLLGDIFGTTAREEEEEKEKEDIEQTQNELEQSNLTYSKSQYNDFADTIYTALQSGFTEDEEAIYTVFKRLKNNDDFKQLKLSYGSRLIGLYGFRVSMNLTKSIRSLLNDDECKHINYIMSNRGLTTRI